MWGVKHLDSPLKIQDFTDFLSYKCSCILTLNCNTTKLSDLFWVVMLYFFYFLDTSWSFYSVYIIFMSLENVKMVSSCKKINNKDPYHWLCPPPTQTIHHDHLISAPFT